MYIVGHQSFTVLRGFLGTNKLLIRPIDFQKEDLIIPHVRIIDPSETVHN